jgi:hypothetical protein
MGWASDGKVSESTDPPPEPRRPAVRKMYHMRFSADERTLLTDLISTGKAVARPKPRSDLAQDRLRSGRSDLDRHGVGAFLELDALAMAYLDSLNTWDLEEKDAVGLGGSAQAA